MATVSIVVFITLTFAIANLLFQLMAVEAVRRDAEPKTPKATMALEHPVHTRLDGGSRTRTDRHDLQLAMGHDFAAPDIDQSVWPRDPRI